MQRLLFILSLFCVLLSASQCAKREWNNPWDPESPNYNPGPRPPRNLEGAGRDRRAQLRWMESPEEDVVGYGIYRSRTSGNDYSLLAKLGRWESYVDDNVLNDSNYYYVVTAFDSITPPRESGYSNEVEVTPLEEIELTYDDGSPDGALCWTNGEGGVFAVRFTPPGYPCRVVEARYFIAAGWPDDVHQSFGAVVYTGSAHGPGGSVGGETAQPSRGNAWIDVDLSWEKIVISTGDFFVGNKQTTSYPECEGQCFDTTGTPEGRSWQFNGQSWTLLPAEYGNLMIRAIVQIDQ